MAVKTNAARILDKLKIAYEVREYEVDEDDLSAPTVARKVGMEVERVFKTLVTRSDAGDVCFAVVAAHAELDLKALAKLAGGKKFALVGLKDVQPLTGYVRGGVTALGAKKSYPVYADDSLATFDQIAISAGVRGAQLVLAPADYVRATQAKLGPLQRL